MDNRSPQNIWRQILTNFSKPVRLKATEDLYFISRNDKVICTTSPSLEGISKMKIYIDFDDVICETAKYFTKIAKELFDIDVPINRCSFSIFKRHLT